MSDVGQLNLLTIVANSGNLFVTELKDLMLKLNTQLRTAHQIDMEDIPPMVSKAHTWAESIYKENIQRLSEI